MEDISSLIEEFSKIVEKDGIPDNLKEIIDNFNQDDNNKEKSNTSKKNDDVSSFDFNNIDINTFLKLKSAMDKMNSKDNPNVKLLLALKPYLKSDKKEKLDQYIKFMNLTSIMDVLKNSDGDKK